MSVTKSTHINRIAMRSAGIAGLALLAGSIAFPVPANAVSGTSNWNESDWEEQDWQKDQHLQPDSEWFSTYQNHWGLEAQLSVRPALSAEWLAADTEQAKVHLESGKQADFQFVIKNTGSRPVFNVKIEDGLGLGSCLDTKLKANKYQMHNNDPVSVTVLEPADSYTCEITGTPPEGLKDFSAKVTGTRGVYWTSEVAASNAAFVEVAKAVTTPDVVTPVAVVTETPVVQAVAEAEVPVSVPQPSEALPHTGGSMVGWLAGIGMALLLAGAAVVGAKRRHGLS